MIIIDKELLAAMHAEATGCEYCREVDEDECGPLECHHIFSRGCGGGQRLDVRFNLIMLGRKHHDLAQRNRIDRRLLLALAAEREIYRLRRMPK